MLYMVSERWRPAFKSVLAKSELQLVHVGAHFLELCAHIKVLCCALRLNGSQPHPVRFPLKGSPCLWAATLRPLA